MTAVARQKAPRALVLRVRPLGYQVQGFLLGNKIFEEPATYVADNDQDMMWSVDWLDNRPPTAEVMATRAKLPANWWK